MEFEHLKEKIREEFEGDVLHERVRKEFRGREDLEEILYPRNILEKIDIESMYSLTQAAEFFKDKQLYDLRNLINRHSLNEYLEVEKNGKMHRLDFRAIYRFHLVFILKDQANMQPYDIAELVGSRQLDPKQVTTSFTRNSNNVINESNLPAMNHGERQEHIEAQLLNIQKVLFLQQQELLLQKKKSEYQEMSKKLIDIDREIESLGYQAENLELKIEIQKSEEGSKKWAVETSKKIAIEASSASLKYSMGKQKKKGFFQKLFAGNDDEISQEAAYAELMKSINEVATKNETEFSAPTSLKAQLEKTLSEKEGKVKERETVIKEVQELKGFVQKLETKLEVTQENIHMLEFTGFDVLEFVTGKNTNPQIGNKPDQSLIDILPGSDEK
ncbi:hypothetical protein ACFSCX_06630 [Bacillus salitolerans]|uniref:Uncharacterized protein n=1 Tax=Bacillus salitolerans TaxID=1437434 RepID=A0ABW4LN98_9BACI